VTNFNDIFEANIDFSRNFASSGQSAIAKRGLAIITCIDSRIAPLAIVGMQPGDAKIMRNAGARVTEDVLRTLVLATALLGVDRILVMPHTDCRMASGSEEEIHQAILEKTGIDSRAIEIRTVRDQISALKLDIQRIKSSPHLPDGISVVGAIYDVNSGVLNKVE
jgi:carbonic anhydrase